MSDKGENALYKTMLHRLLLCSDDNPKKITASNTTEVSDPSSAKKKEQNTD